MLADIGWVIIAILFIVAMVALIVGVLAACGWVIVRVAFAWERRRFSRPT